VNYRKLYKIIKLKLFSARVILVQVASSICVWLNKTLLWFLAFVICYPLLGSFSLSFYILDKPFLCQSNERIHSKYYALCVLSASFHNVGSITKKSYLSPTSPTKVIWYDCKAYLIGYMTVHLSFYPLPNVTLYCTTGRKIKTPHFLCAKL
jgi:hypothetical protein